MNELHENQICLNCGKVDIPNDKEYCPKCGFDLNEEDEEEDCSYKLGDLSFDEEDMQEFESFKSRGFR